MTEFATIILHAGRAGVELALFVLLPVMIVMLSFMRLLEAKGILDKLVNLVAPLLRPFGLPGLGVFAMIQILFVSFAAPMATLAMMDRGGSPRRHIAATLAMVLGMAQANVVFPMAALGLNAPITMGISVLCGLVGAALTYHIFAKNLPDRMDDNEMVVKHKEAEGPKGILDVINKAGAEALKITVGAIPMLVLALVFVALMRAAGVMGLLEELLTPTLNGLDLPGSFIMAAITKVIAGGTAMMGVMKDFLDQGLMSIDDFNRLAGFLINPYDVAGIAVLISAGPRVAEVLKPALLGGAIAIALRTVLHWVLL
ncbi:putative membrane protein [Candidatus Terasakiella magnetica]|uniref:Putative membrane protein n=1 Tax=Candidatus Terasakiella magnetica TaxID=1867952 RepID=A0A1C3RKB5_9PROT|nr:nucleoside recognition domain-containing protein [Candidatus Terasakiella magnetica]SCA57686.1 putative membrane protein [Candidatus Terasakiella magnetica]